MDNAKTTRDRPTRSLDDWKQFLDRTLSAHARQRRHGTVRIVFYDGEIRQVLIEQSIVDPVSDLARERITGT